MVALVATLASRSPFSDVICPLLTRRQPIPFGPFTFKCKCVCVCVSASECGRVCEGGQGAGHLRYCRFGRIDPLFSRRCRLGIAASVWWPSCWIPEPCLRTRSILAAGDWLWPCFSQDSGLMILSSHLVPLATSQAIEEYFLIATH